MKIRLLLASVPAALLSLAPPVCAVSPSTVFSDAPTGRKVTLGELRTPVVALHFLPSGAEQVGEVVRGYSAGSVSLAGVTHVFVGGAPGVGSEGPPTDQAQTLIHVVDTGGMLRGELGVDARDAVSVLIDRSGHEVGRVKGEHGAAEFSMIAAAVERAGQAPVAHYNLPKGGPAVQGYDVTAYFLQNKAVKGKPEFTSRYRGVSYYFESARTRAAFNADPERFLPTYGGWCATAMGDRGDKVEIDPTNYKVARGRLFLFYKSLFADARKDWEKNEKQWEPAADRYWKGISGEDPVPSR